MRLKHIWLTYWLVYFLIFLPFTREPDIFNSEKSKGLVTSIEIHKFGSGKRSQMHINPVVHYFVDSVEHTFYADESTNYLGIYQKGDTVSMIYEKGNPHNATINGIIGYWINYTELVIAMLILSLISIIYATIKNWDKMTYNETIKE